MAVSVSEAKRRWNDMTPSERLLLLRDDPKVTIGSGRQLDTVRQQSWSGLNPTVKKTIRKALKRLDEERGSTTFGY